MKTETTMMWIQGAGVLATLIAAAATLVAAKVQLEAARLAANKETAGSGTTSAKKLGGDLRAWLGRNLRYVVPAVFLLYNILDAFRLAYKQNEPTVRFVVEFSVDVGLILFYVLLLVMIFALSATDSTFRAILKLSNSYNNVLKGHGDQLDYLTERSLNHADAQPTTSRSRS